MHNPYNHSTLNLSSFQLNNVDDLDEDDLDRLEFQLNQEVAIADDDDWYGILNLDLNATDEEIRNSYKRWSLIFHPDRHPGPEASASAQEKFQKIQKAYDVLSNPETRAAYDKERDQRHKKGWQIGKTYQSPEDMADEFAHEGEDAAETLERLLRTKNSIKVNVDASRVFDKSNKDLAAFGFPVAQQSQKRGLAEMIQWPEITQVMIKNSWNISLSPETFFQVEGTAIVRNGLGMGNMTGTIRRIITPSLSCELSGMLGASPMAHLAFVHQSRHGAIRVQANTDTTDLPPRISAAFSRPLSEKTNAYISLNSGSFAIGDWGAGIQDMHGSSCTIGLAHQIRSGQINAEIQTGMAMSQISFTVVRPISRAIQGRVSCALSTASGVTTTALASRKVSKLTKVHMGVEFASHQGVSLLIKVSRLGQKLSVPILLKPEFDILLVASALCVPLAGSVLLDKFYLGPKRRLNFAKKLKELREKNSEILGRRKREAIEAINLMHESVMRKIESEIEKNGLIILEAIYGKLPPSNLAPFQLLSSRGIQNFADTLTRQISGPLETDPQEYINVTIPVQNLVNNSQLFISGTHSKSGLMGFYDPCLGEQKRLRITYRFQGKLHQVEVNDRSPVAAPLRGHVVSD